MDFSSASGCKSFRFGLDPASACNELLLYAASSDAEWKSQSSLFAKASYASRTTLRHHRIYGSGTYRWVIKADDLRNSCSR